ncbi:hypothetical protein As57867_007160, partial [Aphanomyces stellatus]
MKSPAIIVAALVASASAFAPPTTWQTFPLPLVPANLTFNLDYLSALPTGASAKAITKANICIHGLSRDVGNCFAFDKDILDRSTSVILAPVFPSSNAACKSVSPDKTASSTSGLWTTCDGYANGNQPSNLPKGLNTAA